jgi:hypothetical protein
LFFLKYGGRIFPSGCRTGGRSGYVIRSSRSGKYKLRTVNHFNINPLHVSSADFPGLLNWNESPDESDVQDLTAEKIHLEVEEHKNGYKFDQVVWTDNLEQKRLPHQ